MQAYNNMLLRLHKQGATAVLCTTKVNSKGTQVTAMCMGYVVVASCAGCSAINTHLTGVNAMCAHLQSVLPAKGNISWGWYGNTATNTDGVYILAAYL